MATKKVAPPARRRATSARPSTRSPRAARDGGAPAGGASLPRWTKVEAVLRLLRGVDADDLAQEFHVDADEVARWRDEFLEAGMHQLTDGAPPPQPSAEPAAPSSAARRRPATSTAKTRTAVGWREQAARRAHGELPGASDDQAPGLRERKKARTRAAIRQHAMRLFHEQGYYETTVNQIAEAADVSPSTFFRYFSTKEDVVFEDDAEVRMSETFHSMPADLGPVRAVFEALLHAMASTTDPDAVRQQVTLCLSVPELRATLFDNLTQLMNEIAELVAHRVKRKASDFDVRIFAAAVQGVWYSVLFDWAEDPSIDLDTAMMDAAQLLEKGLPL